MYIHPDLKNIGFDEPLTKRAGIYWGERIRIARRQRNALINLCAFVVLSLFVSRFAGIDPDVHWLMTLMQWMYGIAIALSVAMLALLEVATYQYNKALVKPPLPMNSEQRRTVVKLGNTIAVNVLMFKRPPPPSGLLNDDIF